MKKLSFIFFIVITISWVNQSIHAKDYHVTDGRELFLAFLEASSNGENDHIYLAAGVYKGEFIFETSEAKSLTLTTEQGLTADQVVFDGEQIAQPLNISSEVSTDVSVRNISIHASNSYGIKIKTLGDVEFFNNNIYNNSGTGVIINTDKKVLFGYNLIHNNNSGGGKINTKSFFTFHHNSVYDNKGGEGGIRIESNTNESIDVFNNTIIGNTGDTGILIQTEGDLSFFDNLIKENSTFSSYVGTAILSSKKNLSIINNVVLNNKKGGLAGYANQNVSMIHNIVKKNTYYSGIITSTTNGKISLIDNIVKENTSETEGGGVFIHYSDSAHISLTRNEITDNSSERGGAGVNISSTNSRKRNNTDIVFSNNSITENKIISKYDNLYAGGVYIKNCRDILFQNNDISKNINNKLVSGIMILQSESVILRKNTIHQNNIEYSSGNSCTLYVDTNDLHLSNNDIKNNIVPSSGTVLNTINTGSLILSRNTFVNNKSGAIRSVNASSIDITSNIIEGNNEGTGMHIDSSSENSITCTISSNIIKNFGNSSNEGGGIYVNNFKQISIWQNLIFKNKAVRGGGVFLNPKESLSMVNNTIASNTAEMQGGGLYVKTSNMTSDIALINNIFWDNTAANEGDDIFLYGFGGNPRVLENNTVREIFGTFETKSNNISSDPLFFSLETDDYHLRPGSPCINIGKSFMLDDLDGVNTYQSKDIGAYEYNPTTPHPADINANFNIEESEYNNYNNSWRNNIEWTKSPIDIPIEYNTRAGFIIENGGSYTNTGAMKPLCWTPDH